MPRARRSGRVKASRVKDKLRRRDGTQCHYCRVEMTESDDKPQIATTETIEHVVPRQAGGTNEMHNLVLACNTCNNKYGDVYDKCDCEFCESARYMYETGTHTEGYLRGTQNVAVYQGGTGPSNLVWSSNSAEASDAPLHNLQLLARYTVSQ